MEKQTRKTRKSPVRDPIRQLAGRYRRKIRAAHREIDELAQRGENRKVSTPNYVQEVISPLAGIIGTLFPNLDLVLSEKVERINAKEAYYLLRAGETVLGGFSYPGPNAGHIDFTLFAHGKPWGRVVEITRQAQLLKVITGLAEFLGLGQNASVDEQQK
ncbi:MAG: hypothetical protein LBV18_02105 [Alistipes sp.]|jgi:hypothetical protein|nr:hypothetical protein [Alistipes sp.]